MSNEQSLYGVQWSIVPSGMVPSAQTVREAKFETTAGVVKFAVGQSGSIVFVAPITTSLPAGRYVLRVVLERDDPTEPNQEPGLLGTNLQLWRRNLNELGDTRHVLKLDQSVGAPVLGGQGIYVADSDADNFPDGFNVDAFFYWIQVEMRQQSPATDTTRNSVMGIMLMGDVGPV
jgi:hypothetical protein